MAKAKADKTFIFTNGGNLPDGTRFEAGDVVPGDLTPATMRSLKANGLISDDDGIDLELNEEGELE